MTQESDDSKKRVADQESEATSKETLEDLEESEKISDSDTGHDSGDAELPAPDGTLDDTRKPDDAGPM